MDFWTERVRILLNLIGYQPAVEIHYSMIEKVAWTEGSSAYWVHWFMEFIELTQVTRLTEGTQGAQVTQWTVRLNIFP